MKKGSRLSVTQIKETQSDYFKKLPLVVIQHSCPLCTSKDLKPLKNERNRFPKDHRPILEMFDGAWIQLLQCKTCGFGFTKELPYSEDFFPSRYDTHFDAANEANNNPFKDEILDKMIAVIEKYKPSPGKVLDVGSFAGIFIRKIAKRNYKSSGIEVNPTMADYTKNILNLDVQKGTFLSTHVEKESFDVVTMIDVLEHLVDPRQIIQKVQGVLKPGGLFVIKVPNLWPQYYKQKIANLIGISDQGIFENFGHINHFSPKSLRYTLESLGMDVLEDQVSDSENWPKTNLKNILKNHFRTCFNFPFKLIKSIFGINLGLNFIIYAKKKDIAQ